MGKPIIGSPQGFLKMHLTTIATFRDVPAAHLARSRLEADGIEASLLDVNLVGVDWSVSQAVGGIRLQVRVEDAEHARELLMQDRSQDLEETPEAHLPALAGEECPRCGSDRVRGSRLEQKTKGASMLFGFLVAVFVLLSLFERNRRSCAECGFSWKPESA